MQRILRGLDGLSLRLDHGLKSCIQPSGLANQNIQSNENRARDAIGVRTVLN